MSSMKLKLDAAEMMARKRLARRIAEFETIYVLHRDDRKGYLLLLALEEEQWRILESVSLDHDTNRMEEFHEMPIDKDGIEAIRLALKHWSADKTPGRPAKYDPNREGQEIFVYHVYGGKPIRDIAKEFRMGPATVQKLLNQVRFQVADRFVSGELPLTPDMPNYDKNVAVLQWAVRNSKGEKKARYAEFLKNALSNI
ncbi:MAG: hypothetical protein IJU05_02740 [Schwartzia sp.]|nr:hypothetical protein [Schwartzia sp. (in: firmicutes)]